MIKFTNVNKWYGDYRALTDINAEVKKGEVVVVCGPSGSGKRSSRVSCCSTATTSTHR